MNSSTTANSPTSQKNNVPVPGRPNVTSQVASLSKAKLRATARMLGLQASYLNPVWGDTAADPEVLLQLAADLSERELKSDADLDRVRDDLKNQRWMKGVPDSIVAWGGRQPSILIFLSYPSGQASRQEAGQGKGLDLNEAKITLLEDETRKFVSSEFLSWQADRIRVLPQGEVWRLSLNLDLKRAGYALGAYFNLTLTIGSRIFSSLLICPPQKLQTNAELAQTEGPFLPLHALRTGDETGMGSLRELRILANDLRAKGARWISLFPLLPGKFESPDCDPSPYSALSRLFWNEIYIDLDRALAHVESESARTLVQSRDYQARAKRLREADYADYYEVYQLKKEALSLLAEQFFASGMNQSDEYQNFLSLYPDLDAYAKFRSIDAREQRFHCFVQFEMHCQLRDFNRESGLELYMDFPIGVYDGGFDQQANKEIFFRSVSVGAPPEQVFRNGQDWGFSPFHPTRIRKSGYRYFRKALRHHLQFAKILRLDHVMGLFRVFAIPKGLSAKKGVYLRYAPEDLFAIAVLEASRAGADFIGENLGTVPEAVNVIMKAHGIKGMWVLEMETHRTPEQVLSSIPNDQLVCLNTHDMPMLTTYLECEDLPEVLRLGIIDSDAEKSLKADRERTLRPWIKSMGSPAEGEFARTVVRSIRKTRPLYFVINPEDLVGERRPMNIPGTYKEVPNWTRKFAFTGVPWVN